MIICDARGIIQWTNPAFTSNTGWSADQVLVRDADGRIVNFVGIETDITARKQREAELIDARLAAENATGRRASSCRT